MVCHQCAIEKGYIKSYKEIDHDEELLVSTSKWKNIKGLVGASLWQVNNLKYIDGQVIKKGANRSTNKSKLEAIWGIDKGE